MKFLQLLALTALILSFESQGAEDLKSQDASTEELSNSQTDGQTVSDQKVDVDEVKDQGVGDQQVRDQSVTENEARAPLPYELEVTPTMSRANLRVMLEKVEDDFFRRFNELNLDDAYDVACYRFTPTMSHITRRVCEPFFFISARATNAGDVMDSFGICSTCARGAPVMLSRRGLRQETHGDMEVLQEKLEAFNASDPELRSIGSALARVKSQLANFGEQD